MNITKDITRLEKSSVKLNVTISKDDVNSEYNELISTYAKSIQLPGFRKGKVPRDVLIRKFGDALKGEAAGKIIEKAIESIFSDESFPRENQPLPYSTPALQGEPKLDLESDLHFSLVYDVLPAVKVENWQGLEVEIPDVSIGEEDINRELESVRERNSIVLDKNDGEEAATGDVVTVTYCELDDSGVMLENSEREDFAFTLGSGNNIYRFDDEILGMKKGETKEFSKTFAEDHVEFAGQTKKIKLSLTALKIKKLPDLDDDLAQDVDEKFHTLEDLKDSINQRLNKDLEQSRKSIKINKILEKIMENTPVDIPESMLRAELDSRWRNLARRLNTDTNGLYKMMGNSAGNAESLIESWKPDALKALHSRLIIETVMEDLKLEASDNEAEAEIEKMASEDQDDLEKIKEYYSSNSRMKDLLKEEIKERKFFDILLDKSTFITGEKKSYMDLASNNG